MLDGLKRKIAAAAIMSLLKSLATNKDTQTSITGLIAAAIITIPGLDVAKTIAGDPMQIAHLVSGLLLAGISLLATRENHDGSTTALGTIAGVLQACSGQVADIAVGVVIALLGYFTNKPAAAAPVPRE